MFCNRFYLPIGKPVNPVQEMFTATVIAKLKSKIFGYCPDSDDTPTPSIIDLFAPADQLFRHTLKNEQHVLQPSLRDKTNITYNLRPRNHDRQLTRKSVHVNDSPFIVRMLYKDSY